MTEEPADTKLHRTPLADLHGRLGARMVPFAGFSMPLQYSEGTLAEHARVRNSAGLFDVSHMGQVTLSGPPFEVLADELERVTPGDIAGLAPGRLRYTVLLNDEGGIVDDLMVTRPAAGNMLDLVINAEGRERDIDYFRDRLPATVAVRLHDGRALLALQGPKAVDALRRHVGGVADLAFMASAGMDFDGMPCTVSRSGYTGEDGFEISLAAADAVAAAEALLAEPEVAPIGLAARDSLRLEAGLCLYGHDLDETTSPVEADLGFVIARRRREKGGFAGEKRILAELRDGPSRRRVGLRLEGRAPAREGAEVMAEDGRRVGTVTSGGFGPTAGVAVAFAYVEPGFAAAGTKLMLQVRARRLPATVAELPFVPHRYHRKPKGSS